MLLNYILINNILLITAEAAGKIIFITEFALTSEFKHDFYKQNPPSIRKIKAKICFLSMLSYNNKNNNVLYVFWVFKIIIRDVVSEKNLFR